ncbi:hypothetical protein F511_40596 [Dorcoceras hygrometricum]|uniref:Uncharacterized protein n=1 Tax=Dorcoceras hygrometricum TaxID=472368 RepID=A0A2Z7BZE9_9LAMI|nr:hypothetical protein F511_40596 [Dorcoceras hygrometricum]
MVAKENKSAWADSDSEESSSGTFSSSENEDEVQCLMTDDTEEIFDFSNLKFTALNEMVQEYEKLSQLFEEVKAEKESCANKSESVSKRYAICFNTGQPVEAQSGETMIAAQLPIWKGRFCGLGYTAPKKPRESWLKRRVEQMRGKSKSGGRKPGQFSRLSQN